MATEYDLAANKKLARRYAEIINTRDLRLADEICSPKFIDHTAPAGFDNGLEGAKAFLQQVIDGFPDVRLKVDELVAEGDRVVISWTATGTHKGAFMGVPASQKKTKTQGMELIRIRKGRVTDSWHVEDMLGLFQQVGAIHLPSQMVAA